MKTDFVIPNSAVKYILLQRTDIQRYRKVAQKLRIPLSLHCFLETFFSRQKIKRGFIKSILDDYESIKSYLPSNASRILDIGSGVAGIDVMLYRHYGKGSNIEFFLLDRTEENRDIYYGFRREGAFYNSLDVAKLMLLLNGIKEQNIHLLNATSDYRINVSNIDLVISLLSWGFHYPISVYIEQVYRSLKEEYLYWMLERVLMAKTILGRNLGILS